jgi:RHS repeat-associated protein
VTEVTLMEGASALEQSRRSLPSGTTSSCLSVCRQRGHRGDFRKTGCSANRSHVPRMPLFSARQRISSIDPFGNILSMSGPLADANTYRFSSQEYHQNTGLVLYLYRAYDPNLQRWINRDPIGELGGVNLYRFVSNDPVGRVDPDGDSDHNVVSRVTVPISAISLPRITVTPVAGSWLVVSPINLVHLENPFPAMGPNGQPFWAGQLNFTESPNGYGSEITINGNWCPSGACNTVNGGDAAGSLLFGLDAPPGEYNVSVKCRLELSGTKGAGAHAKLFQGTNELFNLYGGDNFPFTLYTNYSFPIIVGGSNPVPFLRYVPSIGVGSGSGTAKGTFTFSVSL